MFDNDINVVSNPTGEYKDFVNAINTLFEVIGKLLTELPLYKLYDNQVARMYKEATMVSHGENFSLSCNGDKPFCFR